MSFVYGDANFPASQLVQTVDPARSKKKQGKKRDDLIASTRYHIHYTYEGESISVRTGIDIVSAAGVRIRYTEEVEPVDVWNFP